MVFNSVENHWHLSETSKPFHLTGEIDQDIFLKRLTEKEYLSLVFLLENLHTLAAKLKTFAHILVVGSSADLKSDYGDIDLLVCPEKKEIRQDFTELFYEELRKNKQLTVIKQFPKGSASIINPLYFPCKLFVSPLGYEPNNRLKSPMLFDMTFVGIKGGSFEDAVNFHREQKLAFSILKKPGI